MADPDFLTIVVSKAEVVSGNTSKTLAALQCLTAAPAVARTWRERVDFVIDGYNDTRWELFEIPEVRSFVVKLDDHFPFWLFFLSKHALGLQCIVHCFLPPFLKPRRELNYSRSDSTTCYPGAGFRQ